jgi:hypothetical protein
MRRTHSTASLLAAAGILAAAALLQAAPATDAPAKDSSAVKQSQKEPAKASETAKAKQSQQAPEGFVIVDEQLVTLTANEPQNHFLRAKEYLAQNDPRAAAAEIRIGAVYLDMQASRKGQADQQELRSDSAHLRSVADEIAKGTDQPAVASGGGKQEGAASTSTGQSSEQKRLNHTFAQTERVLAKHFQEEASRELGKNKSTMAGEDLDAAVSALSGSMAWSGQACSKDCASALTDARRVSDELLTPVTKDKAQSGAKTDENKSGTSNEAQPAAARISANVDAGATETARVPADAEKVIEALGKSIESVDSKGSPEQSKEKPAPTEQHSATDAKTK